MNEGNSYAQNNAQLFFRYIASFVLNNDSYLSLIVIQLHAGIVTTGFVMDHDQGSMSKTLSPQEVEAVKQEVTDAIERVRCFFTLVK